VVTEAGGLRWFDPGSPLRSRDEWRALIEARTAMTLDPRGEAVFLPLDEWEDVRQQVAEFAADTAAGP
jgi:hypothetical protein